MSDYQLKKIADAADSAASYAAAASEEVGGIAVQLESVLRVLQSIDSRLETAVEHLDDLNDHGADHSVYLKDVREGLDQVASVVENAR